MKSEEKQVVSDCTIRLGASYLLKKVIEKIIERQDAWHLIVNSEEYVLLRHFYSAVDGVRFCENGCQGCLDYALVMRLFNKFFSVIFSADEKYAELLTQVEGSLARVDASDRIGLVIDVFSHPAQVERCLDEHDKSKLSDFVNAVDDAYCALALGYFRQKIDELHDVILTGCRLADDQVIQYELVDVVDYSKIFYVDQNFISKYVNSDNFRCQIDNSKNMLGYRFAYSPYVVEDGIKMSRVFLSGYIESILGLTDGLLVANKGGELAFVKEPIRLTVSRVLDWAEVTRAAEELRVFQALEDFYSYPSFRRSSPLAGHINRDVSSFFKDLVAGAYGEGAVSTVDAAMKSGSCGFDLSNLASGAVPFENEKDCQDKIKSLFSLLDTLNYKTPPLKDKKQLRSSFQDEQHLMHAWKCKYFITEDSNLRKRGRYIYSLLGFDTQFLDIKQFMDLMVSAHKRRDST